MNKFKNSKEFNDIINNLNNKNFSKVLEKIDLISKKYKNENIILKLYAVTYFNLMEWEKAIEYFKKNLTFEKSKYKIYLLGECSNFVPINLKCLTVIVRIASLCNTTPI